jgi:hypothetical protein
MTSWHRATIKFQYSPQGSSARVISQTTTQVYGNTESAALAALRKLHPSWTDFVLIDIDWHD